HLGDKVGPKCVPGSSHREVENMIGRDSSRDAVSIGRRGVVTSLKDPEETGLRRAAAPELRIIERAVRFEMRGGKILAQDDAGGAQSVLHVGDALELPEYLQASRERLGQQYHDEQHQGH